MNQPACHSCRHFRRHYVLGTDCAMTTNCGHCIAARVKHRRPDAPACPRYEPGDLSEASPREQVIQYLSTEMLDYIRSLPLPPEIR